MKKLTLTFLFICSMLVAFSQCNDYYVLQDGTSWTYENYNGKGKPTGKNIQKVKSFEKTTSGFVATINSTVLDDKGKTLTEGDLEMTCENGTITMDMRKFIPQEQLKALSSYEMKIESENLELPSKLTVGQSLKDGSVSLTTEGSPIPMSMAVTISNRKVVGKETITTPAGTFDCYKITNTSHMKSKIGINFSADFSGTEWIAEKVGFVKSESFDKKGKLNGSILLIGRQ